MSRCCWFSFYYFYYYKPTRCFGRIRSWAMINATGWAYPHRCMPTCQLPKLQAHYRPLAFYTPSAGSQIREWQDANEKLWGFAPVVSSVRSTPYCIVGLTYCGNSSYRDERLLPPIELPAYYVSYLPLPDCSNLKKATISKYTGPG